jgi:hypothetical protein
MPHPPPNPSEKKRGKLPAYMAPTLASAQRNITPPPPQPDEAALKKRIETPHHMLDTEASRNYQLNRREKFRRMQEERAKATGKRPFLPPSKPIRTDSARGTPGRGTPMGGSPYNGFWRPRREYTAPLEWLPLEGDERIKSNGNNFVVTEEAAWAEQWEKYQAWENYGVEGWNDQDCENDQGWGDNHDLGSNHDWGKDWLKAENGAPRRQRTEWEQQSQNMVSMDTYQQVINERDKWEAKYERVLRQYEELLVQETEEEAEPQKPRAYFRTLNCEDAYPRDCPTCAAHPPAKVVSESSTRTASDDSQTEVSFLRPQFSSDSDNDSSNTLRSRTTYGPDSRQNEGSRTQTPMRACYKEDKSLAITTLRTENADLKREYFQSLLACFRTQNQFDELADEAKELIWAAKDLKPRIERWESLEDPEKVVRAMNRLQNDIVAMAEAFQDNPLELDTFIEAPEVGDDYLEDMVLIRQKVAETLQEGAIEVEDRSLTIDELDLKMREQEQKYQEEIKTLEAILSNATAQLSRELNNEDPNAEDSWRKLYENNISAHEELRLKYESLQHTVDSQRSELLRLGIEHREEFDRKKTEWLEKEMALEEDIRNCKTENQNRFVVSQAELQELRRQLDALKELLRVREEDLKAEKDQNVRLRRECAEAQMDAKILRGHLKDMRRRSRDASFLPSFRANDGRRPRYESVEETNWRIEVPLAALKERQMAEWEAYRREEARLEALRKRKMGTKYPPARQRWGQLVAMTADERWACDDDLDT